MPGLVLAAFGVTLPARDLDKQIQEKKNMIIIELPDFLDMLIISCGPGEISLRRCGKRRNMQAPT